MCKKEGAEIFILEFAEHSEAADGPGFFDVGGTFFKADFLKAGVEHPLCIFADAAETWECLQVPIGNPTGFTPGPAVGPNDQRSKIGTFNIAPSWTHLVNTHSVFTLGGFVRRDDYNYYPSNDPFADLGPPSLQRQSVGQNRTLTNAGIRSDISYVKGVNQIKAGVTYEQTLLNENDRVGIVDPAYNAPCLTLSTATDANVPVPGFTDPSQCAGFGFAPNVADSASPYFNPNAPNSAFYPAFNSTLFPYDLTRRGRALHLQRTHGREGVGALSSRRSQQGKLVSEPRDSWRFL